MTLPHSPDPTSLMVSYDTEQLISETVGMIGRGISGILSVWNKTGLVKLDVDRRGAGLLLEMDNSVNNQPVKYRPHPS